MVDFTPLSTRKNVILLKGATQHWSDLDHSTAPHLINRVALRQVSGDTLVIGPVSRAMRESVAEAAASVHFLVRNVPDAEQIARNLPDAPVWCGDVTALPATKTYDTVLVLGDLSVITPLEFEPRCWREIYDAVAARLSPGGSLTLVIENDLGLHRVTGPANPRSSDTDSDWDLRTTWDESRPRTLTQIEQRLEGSLRRYAAWPNLRRAEGLVDVDACSAEQATAFAIAASVRTIDGPDPLYLIDAAAAADRVNDMAAAWVVVVNPRRESPAALLGTENTLEWPVSPAERGRSVLGAYHDLAAAEDFPGMRRLVGAWSEAVADGRHDASFALNIVDESGGISGLRQLQETHEGRWAALADVVAMQRNRAWRTPWPATDDAAARLRQLGSMAQLPEISHSEAQRLLPLAPALTEDINIQQLLDIVATNERELHTMRSKLRWVQMQLDAATQQLAAGTPKGFVQGVAVKAKRLARKTTSRVLREVGLR